MSGVGLPMPGAVPRVQLAVGLRVAVLAVLIVYSFYPVLIGLVRDWSTYSEYSFAFLVPGISSYMLWRRRESLFVFDKPSAVGFGLFAFGLTMLLVGYIVAEDFVQRVALPTTLMGLVYFLGGWSVAKTWLPPLSYLFLMVPIPYLAYKAMALELRLLDAKVVAAWASLLGVPVLQDGYLLHLPRITLEVADACSGTLSLLALVALGTFYISEKDMTIRRKAVLWMTLIPVSILANIMRICVIVVLVHYSGNWILETTFHSLVGTVNFVLGFSVILLLGVLLGRGSAARSVPV